MGTPRQFLWTDAAVADLRKLYSKGCSASQIAKALVEAHGGYMTRSAAIGKMHRLSLANADLPPEVRKYKRHVAAPPALRKFTEPSAPRRLVEKPTPPKAPVLRTAPVMKAAPILVDAPLPPERPGLIMVSEREHTAMMCTFPVGDPKADDFHRCGVECEPDAKGRPLCGPHRALMYKPNPPQKAKRAHRDFARLARHYA